mmetsp:Transcript_105236/g.303549  ORF Transcript_105236/g.303549 Transcript_105236/m.303549 type:complete len:370 (-) Transcript_105236:4211-5320(-)
MYAPHGMTWGWSWGWVRNRRRHHDHHHCHQVWPYARSEAEISANYRLGVDTESVGSANLPNFYLSFDDVSPACPISFTPGSCLVNRGSGPETPLLGKIPMLKQIMDFGTIKAPPTTPRLYPSGAPVTAQGQPVVQHLNCNGTALVTLRSYDPDDEPLNTSLLTAPSHGRLVDVVSGREILVGDLISRPVANTDQDQDQGEGAQVIYIAFTFEKNRDATGLNDTFSYAVTDGGDPVSARVFIRPYMFPEPTDSLLELDQDSMAWTALGEIGYDNKRLDVVITALPARGVLYHAAFPASLQPSYALLVSDESDPLLVPIELGAAVNDVRGVVQYFPGANEFDEQGYANFSYSFRDKAPGKVVGRGQEEVGH